MKAQARLTTKDNVGIDCRWLTAVGLVVAVLLAGCSTKQGWIIQSPEVTTAFKSDQAYENHTYYYRDWLGEPIAVIGIQQGYTLDSEFWFEVDLNEVSIYTLVTRMQARDPTRFFGATLRDPAGNVMGIWYSDSQGATIQMKSATVIDYITPWPMDPIGEQGPVRPEN